MSVLNMHSGILDICHYGRCVSSPQPESVKANRADPLEQLINDLAGVAEVEAAIHSLCVTHMARYGLTSWDGGESALNFWCNGIDATIRWDVTTNPLEPADPPICLLSVDLGDAKTRVIYGGVVADLRGAGPLLLSQAIISLLSQALRYEAAA
jgi:hypothetical protein